MRRPGARPSAVLLDTCALIWMVDGSPIAEAARSAIRRAAMGAGVLVSPISAWEVGLLSRARSSRAIAFLPDPASWFAKAMAAHGVQPAEFTAAIAIASSQLPEPLHGDPTDRLLIATARHLAVPIVTRDARILDYAAAGHVRALAC